MYYKKIKDFKPAIADQLNQIINKIVGSNNNNADDNKNLEDKTGSTIVKKKSQNLKRNNKSKKDILNTSPEKKNINVKIILILFRFYVIQFYCLLLGINTLGITQLLSYA